MIHYGEFDVYLCVPELVVAAAGPNIDRKTFIIGKDGQVKTSFVDIGYDADKTRLTNHVAEVGLKSTETSKSVSNVHLSAAKTQNKGSRRPIAPT